MCDAFSLAANLSLAPDFLSRWLSLILGTPLSSIPRSPLSKLDSNQGTPSGVPNVPKNKCAFRRRDFLVAPHHRFIPLL
jgi:hypothetical protein